MITLSGVTVESYVYDGAGNILSAVKNGTTHTYSYGDTNWRDLLTSYDGQSITYDPIGNPLNYLGNTLTWQNGRQPASVESKRVPNRFGRRAGGYTGVRTLAYGNTAGEIRPTTTRFPSCNVAGVAGVAGIFIRSDFLRRFFYR